jgi:hypothetical protein
MLTDCMAINIDDKRLSFKLYPILALYIYISPFISFAIL